MFAVLAAAAQTDASPSVWYSIVESFPTDPASLFTIALFVGAAVWVLVAGVRSNRGTRDRGGDPT